MTVSGSLPTDIVVKVIVAAVHHQRAKADGQREEGLLHGAVPDDRIEQLLKLGRKEEGDAREGALLKQRDDQQRHQHHVGEDGGEVGHL